MSMSSDEIKNPYLMRKWRKYYRIEEVDNHLLRVANQIEEERAKLAALRTQYETMGWKSSEMEDKIARKDQIISEQIREIGELGVQLTQGRIRDVQQSEQIAQQDVEITQLKTRIEKLGELIAANENQNTDDIILEAARKAEKIVTKAVEDRDKMQLQIDEKRSHLIAACRAAYYNALQFKQNLAEHFRHMEQELDASIDVLQDFDHSRLALNHTAVQTKNDSENSIEVP